MRTEEIARADRSVPRLSEWSHGCDHTDGKGRMIERVIEARARDLGGFSVGRVLPTIGRRFVGPFVLFDHMLPANISALAVRPHPHINLGTVTYLFEGEIMHRDSLGSQQLITPGAIN